MNHYRLIVITFSDLGKGGLSDLPLLMGEAVSKCLQEGWTCQGGIAELEGIGWAQAVIK